LCGRTRGYHPTAHRRVREPLEFHPPWLEEVEEGGSDWLNGFVTFLYGLINPLEEEQEEHSVSGGLVEAPEEEDDDEEEEEVDEGFRKRGAHDDGSRGQKIVIVGLQNQ